MEIDWTTVTANLTSVAILLFGFGFLAARVSSPVRLPSQAYEAITLFLLVAIGLKGGVALREHWSPSMVLPIIVTVALGALIPLIAFWALGFMTSVDSLNRGSIAAHYGSTSLVTFTAVLLYLDARAIASEDYLASLLVVLEIPGIIVGIWLAIAGNAGDYDRSSFAKAVQEVFTGKTVFVLVGATVVGAVAGSPGYAPVEPFFTGLMPGLLALFLMHLGHVAGSRLDELRKSGVGLLLFGLLFPLVAGTLGAVVGSVIGLTAGGAAVLATLLASASYIAAPAAVSIALPKANLSLAIAPSLAVTFPLNLTLGIPLYYTVAEVMTGIL